MGSCRWIVRLSTQQNRSNPPAIMGSEQVKLWHNYTIKNQTFRWDYFIKLCVQWVLTNWKDNSSNNLSQINPNIHSTSIVLNLLFTPSPERCLWTISLFQWQFAHRFFSLSKRGSHASQTTGATVQTLDSIDHTRPLGKTKTALEAKSLLATIEVANKWCPRTTLNSNQQSGITL